MLEAPPSENRPLWKTATSVEPNEKLSGSTWVRWKLFVFVYGSVLSWVSPVATAGDASRSAPSAEPSASPDHLMIDRLRNHGSRRPVKVECGGRGSSPLACTSDNPDGHAHARVSDRLRRHQESRAGADGSPAVGTFPHAGRGRARDHLDPRRPRNHDREPHRARPAERAHARAR